MRDPDDGLFEGPFVVVANGLFGGLVVPGEFGSIEVLEAYLEFLVDMWKALGGDPTYIISLRPCDGAWYEKLRPVSPIPRFRTWVGRDRWLDGADTEELSELLRERFVL